MGCKVEVSRMGKSHKRLSTTLDSSGYLALTELSHWRADHRQCWSRVAQPQGRTRVSTCTFLLDMNLACTELSSDGCCNSESRKQREQQGVQMAWVSVAWCPKKNVLGLVFRVPERDTLQSLWSPDLGVEMRVWYTKVPGTIFPKKTKEECCLN